MPSIQAGDSQIAGSVLNTSECVLWGDHTSDCINFNRIATIQYRLVIQSRWFYSPIHLTSIQCWKKMPARIYMAIKELKSPLFWLNLMDFSFIRSCMVGAIGMQLHWMSASCFFFGQHNSVPLSLQWLLLDHKRGVWFFAHDSISRIIPTIKVIKIIGVVWVIGSRIGMPFGWFSNVIMKLSHNTQFFLARV